VVEASGKHAFATTLDEHNRNIALAKSRGLR
jgi:cell division protein YceG involved in septum cleavage